MAPEMPTQSLQPVDAQSQAVADLVVGTGTVQQAVPAYGNKKHLQRAEKISKRIGKGKTGRPRKTIKNIPPTSEQPE
jgi:hypothetical protein